MSENISPGCIVVTEFAVSGSSVFSGYIDYMDRETAVRNDHISDFSLYTDYMDNPEKTTDLFTANSDHLTAEEKQNYKRLYEKAQDNGSPMWQTVISFDNSWLEKNGLYDSESGFISVKTLMNYTREAVKPMLKSEGLENAVWTAAFHYNTDNLHVHIATVEPTPTRKKVSVKTIRFSAEWVKTNEIIRHETVTFDKKVAAHKEKNYGYRNIHNRITEILSEQGYNTRLLGDHITIHSNGSIDLSYNGDNKLIPDMAKLVDEHLEYKGKFKQSSIDKCRSKMVNQIIDHAIDNQKLNEVMRNNIAVTMKGNILFEDRDIVRQFLSVYKQLPEQRNDWNYDTNKIAFLRPELDKITNMYLNKYKADAFAQFKTLVAEEGRIYKEAYGGDADKKRIRNKTKELYKICGNAILSQMKAMNLRDIRELESNSYIAAEVNEAAVTGDHLDFDGRISYKTDYGEYENTSKYWTDHFKTAKADLAKALKLEGSTEKAIALEQILSIFTDETANGNDVAAYELGRCYKLGTFGEINPELSQKYYETAFKGFVDELNSDTWLQNMIAMDELRNYRHFYSPKEYEKKFRQITKNIERDEWLQDYLHYRVGRMLVNGEGTEKNIPEGITHLEESTSPYAYFTLGNLYYYGNDIKQNYEAAYEYFSLAGFTEDGKHMPFALYNMAEMLEKGLAEDSRFDKDYLYELALSEFIASEKQEPNDLIEYKIATMLLDGKGCEVNKNAAEEYLLKSAVYGNTYAQTKLANLYIKSGKSELADRAIFLLQLAADSKNDLAQYQLGKIHIDKDSKYFDAEKGIELLEKSAEQDNYFAEYALGNMYLKGTVIEKDFDLALEHLMSASDKGNQFAQYVLGILYLNGENENIDPDITKSIEYLEQSSKQGNAFAQYQLGRVHLEKDEVKDIETALEYLKKAEEQNNPYLKYNLGRLYLENNDIHDIDKAVTFLSQSAKDNNPFAAYTLGNLYSKGEFVQPDAELSDRWYTQAYKEFTAIEQDNNTETSDSVLYNLGIMNYNGLGTEKDIDKALSYLLKAAHNDHEFAQYQLGKIYLDNTDVRKNAEYASLWLEKAAAKGNEFAQYILGKAMIEEDKIQDIPKGIEYLNASAEQGNDFAQYQLGKIYYGDEYGVKDIYQALIYFNDSAEQGNEFAQYQIGIIYYKGEDIEQNAELAIDYLSRSATQGNQFAQYTLGVIYLKGEICNSDINKAVKFLEQSADQNNQFAQYQLGKLYYFGTDGIEPDMEKAIDYLTQSAEQGNEYAIALLNWKPGIYLNHSNSRTFSETMISLSSDMRQLFERLANEHDHMLNQMVYQKLEREKEREDNKIQR